MKKTKIITALVAACALALVLAGCGGNSAQSSSATDSSDGASFEATASTEATASPASSEQAQGQASVRIDTEGMGVIEWAYESEQIEFDDDMPYQSAIVNDAYGQTIHIEARDYAEYEGWHFTKWTKDGADFSTDNRIDVLVDGDVQYIAVFEFSE